LVNIPTKKLGDIETVTSASLAKRNASEIYGLK